MHDEALYTVTVREMELRPFSYGLEIKTPRQYLSGTNG